MSTTSPDQKPADPTPLEKFIITMGVQYKRDDPEAQHPLAPETADGNGYFVIMAPDRETARRAAFGMFGEHFSFDYTESQYSGKNEHLGEVGRITVNFPCYPRRS